MRSKKAMILAAGLGARLYPLTKEMPKALVEQEGKTLLQITIESLLNYGFNRIIINIHHFSEMILNYLEANRNFGADITISNESDMLLETGGGLKKASWYFDQGPFLVHNVDVITDLDLESLFQFHCGENNIATLAVMRRETSRPLLMDSKSRLAGWRNRITGDEILTQDSSDLEEVGFSGVYVLSPEIFEMMTETGRFSIMPVFLRLAAAQKIGVYYYEGKWQDMGKFR